jgi:hypothetical protein
MIKTILPALLAGVVLAAAPSPALAAKKNAAPAASDSGTIVPGVAVASLDAVIGNSAAVRKVPARQPGCRAQPRRLAAAG